MGVRGCAPAARQLALLLFAVLLLGGCSTVRETQPPRTATEQLMLSHAAMQSLDQVDFDAVDGADVHVSDDYLSSIDSRFVLGEVRARVLEAGGRLVEQDQPHELIVEPRSAGLGINVRDSVVGIPAIPIPLPGIGTIETPELAIFKIERQRGMASLGVVIMTAEGELIDSVRPELGQTIMRDMAILGIRIQRVRDSVPEELE